jgi:hypothetical protein
LTSDTIYFNITVFDVDNDTFTYLWDFGVGTTLNQKNVTYQFSEPGIYNVTITVNDGLDSETEVVTIIVEPKTSNGDEKDSKTFINLWIIMLIIVVVLLFLLIWWRARAQKDDSEIENNSVEEE